MGQIYWKHLSYSILLKTVMSKILIELRNKP